jgi:hypothetical protein
MPSPSRRLVFCPDTGARAPSGVLMYRKYIPRVPPEPGLGLGANQPVVSYVGVAVWVLRKCAYGARSLSWRVEWLGLGANQPVFSYVGVAVWVLRECVYDALRLLWPGLGRFVGFGLCLV